MFSIFSIVQFKNNGCTTETTSSSSSATYRNGTCFTSAECNNKGGTSSGSCAGGKKKNFVLRFPAHCSVFFSFCLGLLNSNPGPVNASVMHYNGRRVDQEKKSIKK